MDDPRDVSCLVPEDQFPVVAVKGQYDAAVAYCLLENLTVRSAGHFIGDTDDVMAAFR